MAVYEYTAKNRFGHKFAGTYENIDGISALRQELEKLGYVLIKARRGRAVGKKPTRVKQSEVVTFAYKFSEMYSAGLPILKCLEALEQQTQDSAFRYIVADIRQYVETGSSLKKPFEKYRGIFSDFFVGMIGAGEVGGQLAKALEISAVYLEKQKEVRRKVKSAFAYPIAVCATCIVVVLMLMFFVIPVFSKLYKQLHVPLPAPTQVLVYLSFLLRSRWWVVLMAGVGITAGLRKLSRKQAVRAKWDAFKLKMPVFGKLNSMVTVSGYIRAFAMLTSVGVPLIEALEVASQVAHNYKMSEVSKELKEAVETGNPLSKTMKCHNIFPPMIVQLATSGEEAGVLPEMLNKGADFLDKDIDRTVNLLLVKLEPALTVVMGIIVGFLLMSVYLPIFDYMGHLK